MAYSTFTEVSSEFKSIVFSATSPITDTDVTRFITEADAEIDSILGTRFVTPVTGANALILLRWCSISLVKARLIEILRVKNADDKGDQDVGSLSLRKQVLERLYRLAKGTDTLGDAPLISSSGGLDSFLRSEDVAYTFDVNKQQW